MALNLINTVSHCVSFMLQQVNVFVSFFSIYVVCLTFGCIDFRADWKIQPFQLKITWKSIAGVQTTGVQIHKITWVAPIALIIQRHPHVRRFRYSSEISPYVMVVCTLITPKIYFHELVNCSSCVQSNKPIYLYMISFVDQWFHYIENSQWFRFNTN